MPETNISRLAYAMAHSASSVASVAQHKRNCDRHANAAGSLYIQPSIAQALLASVAVEPMRLELQSVCSCVYRHVRLAAAKQITRTCPRHMLHKCGRAIRPLMGVTTWVW